MEKQPLLNIWVNNVSMEEAVNEVEKLILYKKKSYLVAVNVDVAVKAEKDTTLREIINCADMTLVDGQPLVWIAKLHKHPVKSKISGSDLVPKLCELAAIKGYSIFIFGGREGIAERAKTNLEKRFPNIRVVGTCAPSIGFELDSAKIKTINQQISAVCPDLLIVCLGCPKQEKWVYANYRKYNASVSICAGATVDFLAGNVRRAPQWMSRHGLEWLYRFFQEPKRLFHRYFIDDIKILSLMQKYHPERLRVQQMPAKQSKSQQE